MKKLVLLSSLLLLSSGCAANAGNVYFGFVAPAPVYVAPPPPPVYQTVVYETPAYYPVTYYRTSYYYPSYPVVNRVYVERPSHKHWRSERREDRWEGGRHGRD